MHCTKRWVSFAILLAIQTVVAGGEEDDPSSEDVAGVRTVRVLTIGNSFAVNACRFLKPIAESDGKCRIVIGTANIGGCTLEKHAALALKSATDPTVTPYKGVDEKWYGLQQYLQADHWDYVTLQQMSALSYKPDTYQPYAQQLAEIINKHAPAAKILVHQTWAYRPDSPLLEKDGLSQHEMYTRLKAAYGDLANRLETRVIPVGTAFQLARLAEGREVLVRDPNFNYDNPEFPEKPKQTNSLVTGWYWRTAGDNSVLRLDFKHANNKGCLLAGLVWYETLTGNDVTHSKFVPKGVTEGDAVFLRSIAHRAAAGL